MNGERAVKTPRELALDAQQRGLQIDHQVISPPLAHSGRSTVKPCWMTDAVIAASAAAPF